MDEPFKFAALVHSDVVAEIVRRESEEAGYALTVAVTRLDTCVADARALLEAGHEVILCHGHCRHSVFREFSNVTTFIERSDIDIIQALCRAREVCSEVMLTAHVEESYDIAFMEQLVGIRIRLVAYSGETDMHRLIREEFAQGTRVAVGGGVTSGLMEEMGGRTFLDIPHSRNIKAALARARALAARNRLEVAYTGELKEIMQHVKEGVIYVDRDRQVIFCNDQAKKLLKTAREEDLGRHCRELFLERALEEGKTSSDEIISIGGVRLLVNTFPVTRRTGVSGAMAFLHDVASLQKINRKIGDELYAGGFRTRYTSKDILGSSPLVRTMLAKIARYAVTDANVFIGGESGTGKELAAHALHAASPRRSRPFVAVNCSALPESLLESELFGYEEGAFTGARRGGKPGLFELADKGTLFLDEIGEISPAVQLRLLRALESREVMRIGGGRIIPVDVRVISASHQPLGGMVSRGIFRLDLFYRLMGLYLHVPALRERKEDIPVLLGKLLAAYGRSAACLAPSMLARLGEEEWPGNIRELLAVVERYLVLLGERNVDEALFEELLREHKRYLDPGFGPNVGEQLLFSAPSGAGWGPVSPRPRRERVGAMAGRQCEAPGSGALKKQLAFHRALIVRDTLARHGGDRIAAAKELGISATSLRRHLAAED